MVKLYNEDSSLIGYVEKDYAENFCLENPACWFEETTDRLFTKEEVDTISIMLMDIAHMWGLRDNELNLQYKIEGKADRV
jgi:hypothetical protein